MLVRVLTDTGDPKPSALLAKVIEERENDYVIQFLTRSDDIDHGRTVYRYEDETYVVDDDYIIEYLDDEGDAGFVQTTADIGFWVKKSSDADYEPGSDDENDSDEPYDEEEDDENEEYYEEENVYDDE